MCIKPRTEDGRYADGLAVNTSKYRHMVRGGRHLVAQLCDNRPSTKPGASHAIYNGRKAGDTDVSIGTAYIPTKQRCWFPCWLVSAVVSERNEIRSCQMGFANSGQIDLS